MVWLIIAVNLSTSTGHDSLNLTAWEIKREPNAKMTRKVSNKVIANSYHPVYPDPYKKIDQWAQYDCNNSCKNEREQ